MFTRLKVSESLQVGAVVSFDATSQSWTNAADISALVGIVGGAPTQSEGDDFWTAEIIFSGLAYARCTRDIPAEGGMLAVENGGVYVGAVADACGVIAPAPYHDTAPRIAGDFVMVHLR